MSKRYSKLPSALEEIFSEIRSRPLALTVSCTFSLAVGLRSCPVTRTSRRSETVLPVLASTVIPVADADATGSPDWADATAGVAARRAAEARNARGVLPEFTSAAL